MEFRYNQLTTSISKAINNQETPVKEKHVRSAIIGTYHVKGATVFWSVVGNLPIQGNHIACWKMCHTLHKLLREGHPLVIPDSQPYKSKLRELGKYWGHLRDSFGKIICHYCVLLATKLDFHSKNPKFPGNMQITDEDLANIVEADINNFFQLSVEMFDYLEEILNLQAAVFGSLESGRANSMTMSGQCRLSPLIPCIQDSSHLYDYLVKLLFKLHSVLPPDVLLGHRERFYKQYKLLHNFYQLARNLQYFKQLIQIPLLPDDPPNFLRMTDLSNHVSPVVVLPPQPDASEMDQLDMLVVDTISPNLLDADSSNGSVSPELVSDKDRIIERLMQEIDDLKLEIQRLTVEGQSLIDNRRTCNADFESQLSDLQGKLVTKQQEIDQLLVKEEEINENEEMAIKLAESEKKAKVNEEKFFKMKDVYSKLRDEHVTLIRVKADLDKQLLVIRQSSQDNDNNKSELEEKIMSLNEEREASQKLISTLQSNVSTLEEEVCSSKILLNDVKEEFMQKSKNEQFCSFVWCIGEAEYVVKSSLEELENLVSTSMICSPEYLLSIIHRLNEVLREIKREELNLHKDTFEGLLRSVSRVSHFVGQFLVYGKATSNGMSDIEQGDKIVNACRALGINSLNFFSSLKVKESSSGAPDCLDKMQVNLEFVRHLIEDVVQKAALKVEPQIGDLVERELHDMDSVIEEASLRITEILNKSRKADTGVKLEVNEKILDACTQLMQAIKVLVQRSKDLQLEIVAQGKGKSSVKEFYKRNHRWTEGLISAAKAVGLGARFLVDAADKVVAGDAKLEELMVASQEIAASTAQLVVASKVKADMNSENMRHLSFASKDVSHATGNVVATVQSCAHMMDDNDVMDFSKLTLHQAKRLEMDSQVKVLELESNLVKERQKLSGLRKQHYMLAGASEGWEQEIS